MTYFWFGPLLQGAAQLLGGPSNVTLAAGQNTVTISAPTAVVTPSIVLGAGFKVAQDNFEGASGVALATYNPNWTVHGGTFTIQSSELEGTGSNDAWATHSGTYGNDQYARGVVSTLQDGNFAGLIVRSNTGGTKSYYAINWDADSWFLYKYVTATYTQFDTAVVAFSPGDIIEIQAVGTKITVYRNGSVLVSATDASLSAGSPGVTAVFAGPSSRTASWQGGEVVLQSIAISAPAQSQLVAITLAAGQNTVTVSAPTVPSLALTMPQTVNTVTISAPAQSQLVEITLAAGQNTVDVTAPVATGVFDAGGTNLTAGQNTVTISAPAQAQLVEITLAAGQNTVTISAPTVPSVALTMPQTVNTVTVSAPAQSQLVAITLAAGQNTVTISAPAQSTLAETTLAAGQNTVTISAPAQSQLVATTLAAGQNTVTISAPTVPAVDLTMPQTVNTVTISAPAQSQLVAITLAAGQNTVTISAPTVPSVTLTMPQTVNTVTVSAPTALLQQAGGTQTLAADANTVTISAPVVPAVHLLIPTTANEISISAPAQSQLVETFLAATANMVEVSAPEPIVHRTVPAAENIVLISAPAASLGGDAFSLLAAANTVLVINPVMTFIPEQLGALKRSEIARFALTRNDEAPNTQLKSRESSFSDT